MRCGGRVAGAVVAGLLLCARGWAAGTCAEADVPHVDHPHVTISNGEVNALVFLPDATNGYYRSSRFDWSGVVGCAAYRGHTYWGEWFSHYDPMENDSITGPVEEFRSAEGAIGYDAAAVGGLFVKVGVGVLRRDTADSYKFGHVYPIVDTGKWTVRTGPRSVTFRQRLRSPTGVAYEYTKVLSLGAHGSTITLRHSLKNLGAQPLTTDVYDHDFYVLDGQPTGKGMEVRLPFPPMAATPLEPGAEINGQKIVYQQEIEPKATVQSYLTGYRPDAADYDIQVEDTVHHFGVEQRGDLPIEKMYLWSIRTTICPEVYVHLDIAPQQTKQWTLTYRLLADGTATSK